MSVSRLEYFVAVAQERNFARAAARLHITRPALSQQIRKLEDELGHRLVSRSSHRVVLTPAGQSLLPRAREIVESYHRLSTIVDEAARGTNELLRLGVNSSSLIGLVPSVIQRFRSDHPGVTVVVDELWDEQQLEMLRADELDAAIFRSTTPPDGLTSWPLGVDYLHVCLPASHPLAEQEEVQWTQLEGERLLLPDRGRARIEVDTILTAFTREGVPLDDVVITMQGYHGASWVAAGYGILVIPGYATALRQEGTVLLPLSPPHPAMQLRIATRPDLQSGALLALLRAATATANSEPLNERNP
ncbi:LysR family transcriptional regulator [Microbacterium sp. ISL-103]|uniref:LysR family transcriptional regulator n=1 Tax=Microbacterium sp. ISL-103 TaxID=2819156 RepID=UPI001BE5E8F2|nr:LysR substrate-binding domain-containing protein [Microbacterium sp. ISL-103]MBT2475658.1 LysR family transcriptional regulator [Microbacterium sp. ISL-103]